MGCGGSVSESLPVGVDASVNLDGSDSGVARPDACPFVDETPKNAMTFELRNDRAQPTFVSRRECREFFQVTPVDQSILGTFPPAYNLGPCSGRSASIGCNLGEGCPESPLELAPMGHIFFTWNGALAAKVVVPGECEPPDLDPRCPNACFAQHAAPPGRYRVGVSAGSQLSGCQPSGTCVCRPFSDGTCRHEGAIASSDLDALVEFDYPAESAVTVFLR